MARSDEEKSVTPPFIRIRPWPAAIAAGVMVAAAIAGSLVYWPGLMIWDSARQYDQALSGEFDDWHPPAMEWIWRLFLPLAKGPAPMLVLQLALYGAGFVLMIRWALARRQPGRAMALAACTLMPLCVALMADVIKDSLMTAALVLAIGLWIGAPERARGRRLAAATLILAAASLRYNAFLAGAPLLIALAPETWRDRPLRLAGLSLAAVAALMAVMPIANGLLRASRSGVEYSLTIFDLGGIGYHSGQDVFPPLALADPVAINRRCYTPRRWDNYAEWHDPHCPIHFDAVRAAFEQRHLSHRLWWLGAIAAHPLAYAEHRLAHWNMATAFLVHHETGRAIPAHADPIDGDFPIPHTAAVRWVDRLARYSAHTPFGWPACWLALALGLAVLSPTLPSRRWILPLTLSALVYCLGYAVFSVATDERYYLWTMTATAVALAIAVTEPVQWRTLDRRRLLAATAPVTLVAALSTLWRLI
jgi:hypothetical protein